MPKPPASEDDPQPAPKPRSWGQKWFRRLLLALPVLSVLFIVALIAARTYFRSTGQREVAKELARLDAADPGWRFDTLMAAREKAKPPEEQNSAVVVRRVRELTPPEWKEWVAKAPTFGEEPLPLNRHQAIAEHMREGLIALSRPARDLGLTLRDYPRGFHAINIEGPFVASLEETQGAREVGALMKADAILAAERGDAVRGLQAAHAILNTGRSIGDEPSLISSLVRFALSLIAAESTIRVLALTDPREADAELAALQTALYAESDEPILLNGLRGERAMADRFIEGVDNGTIHPDAMTKVAQEKGSPARGASLYFLRTFLPEDRRRFLRLMSDLVEAAKGPPHERIAASERVEAEVKANWDVRYPWHRLMLPATSKVMEASVRHRAELLSVAALIACERFRLKHGRWPESLAELPKDLLPAIPVDPYNGEPMKFARLDDGITVYSVGGKKDANRDDKRLSNPLGGTERGWRLYDPQHRALPPLAPPPRPVLPEPGAP
jgi:hypothetical protein